MVCEVGNDDRRNACPAGQRGGARTTVMHDCGELWKKALERQEINEQNVLRRVRLTKATFGPRVDKCGAAGVGE